MCSVPLPTFVKLLNTIPELHNYLEAAQRKRQSDGEAFSKENRTVGLVPTMGALHAAHRSLMDSSRQTDDIVIVSIFVNPLQFGANEDLDQYPRPQAADQALCEAAGVDAIFMPSPQAFYGMAKPDLSAVTQVVPPLAMVNTLCGHSRPTHFQGVATVVTKLLNTVRPTRAYFGQKDAQQVAILRRMKQDLNLPGEIVVCPSVREPDGLAMSSRNRYLFGPYRQQATVLNRSIRAAKAAFDQGERSAAVLLQTAKAIFDTEPDVTLDYLSLVHPDTLEPLQVVDSIGLLATAAYVGPTPEADPTATQARLLDNIVLNSRIH